MMDFTHSIDHTLSKKKKVGAKKYMMVTLTYCFTVMLELLANKTFLLTFYSAVKFELLI